LSSGNVAAFEYDTYFTAAYAAIGNSDNLRPNNSPMGVWRCPSDDAPTKVRIGQVLMQLFILEQPELQLMQIMVIGCCLELGRSFIKQFLERALHVINGIECRLPIKKVRQESRLRVFFLRHSHFMLKLLTKFLLSPKILTQEKS
jgi:hypothetical protein